MDFLSENKKVLIRRLKMKGMKQSSIHAFVWSLKSCFMDNPDMNHSQTSQRMRFLGWDDFDLDYHTLQLAIACFEADIFQDREHPGSLVESLSADSRS